MDFYLLNYKLSFSLDKLEINTLELEKYKASLKHLRLKRNGNQEMYGKVTFSCDNAYVEDTVNIHFLSGHHAGKVEVQDENKKFKNVFVRFIANSQDYKMLEDGSFQITDTSGKSPLGNYEVLIEEIKKIEEE